MWQLSFKNLIFINTTFFYTFNQKQYIKISFTMIYWLFSGSGKISTDYAYVNMLTRGDLSSLRWIDSPLKHFRKEDNPEKELCKVCYTSLNFRDVMLATGKLSPDSLPGV